MRAVLDSGHSGIPAALQALAALLLVSGLWWLLKRAPALLQRPRMAATMRVEERIALDAKSALVIVRVGERRLLLATADAAAARLVCELPAPALAQPGDVPRQPLAEPPSLEST